MKKKLILLSSIVMGVSTIVLPSIASAAGGGFNQQRSSTIGVYDAGTGGAGSENFLTFVQNAINWILALLGILTTIILIYGGIQMVTAAGDDGKYKKGFTIVKQSVIGLILIGASALIVNLVFSFMNSNATGGGGTGMIQSQSKLV